MYKKDDELGTIEKLERQCLEDSERWFGDVNSSKSISHHTLALAGEVGEFANIVKKIERGSLHIGDAAVRHDLAMELTDVFVYLLNIAGLLGIDLEKSYKVVRAQNEKRFIAERAMREKLASSLRPVKDNPQA